MIRTINDFNFLYLCQSSDWQCVVESESEESAATLAIENIMLNGESDKFSLSASVSVKKLNNNLFLDEENSEIFEFYCPMILANAGFHAEAKILEDMLNK